LNITGDNKYFMRGLIFDVMVNYCA